MPYTLIVLVSVSLSGRLRRARVHESRTVLIVSRHTSASFRNASPQNHRADRKRIPIRTESRGASTGLNGITASEGL
ncbi:hypothetical protein FB446DRAFT_746707 [Lentinula raphanica]|nr:hypothetical protein FB446DRAFT_746707 [Lentinula raphanica]